VSRLTFIGAGNMAEAIIAGLIKQGLYAPEAITALEVNPERALYMAEKHRIRVVDTAERALTADGTVLLCVKPQQMQVALVALRPHLKDQLVITIAAGIRLKFYQSLLAPGTHLIRVMPNTPAMIGLGASVYCAARTASHDDKALCERIFAAVGMVRMVKREALLDAVTALSGSGPAFVYHFAAALAAAGRQAGLPKDLARELTFQTLVGAAQLLQQSGEEPAVLTKKVTSKGGTTLAGLEVLGKKRFTRIMGQCILRATRRAQEMSQEFGR
jgi:pyrroline-5-carboxylate reductase